MPKPLRRKDLEIGSAEFGNLRAYLAQQKISQATINEVIGDATYNRTRAEIAEALRAWLVTLPKKELNIVERVVAAVRGIFSV